MKRIITSLLVSAILLPGSTLAQTRKRTAKPKPSSAATQRVTEVRTAGATKVAEQLKFLTRFIFLLGGVASGIAAVDEAAKRNESSPEIVQKNQQSKATVRSSIQRFREIMDKLEIEFRTTPELQPYYIKLAGVADGTATAEQQAAASQFDAAGRTLLNVVNRLTDVLLAMR